MELTENNININDTSIITREQRFKIYKINESHSLLNTQLENRLISYIKEASLKLIKELGPNGGYIFSSGHSINPAVKLENFLAMRDVLEKHGSY